MMSNHHVPISKSMKYHVVKVSSGQLPKSVGASFGGSRALAHWVWLICVTGELLFMYCCHQAMASFKTGYVSHILWKSNNSGFYGEVVLLKMLS